MFACPAHKHPTIQPKLWQYTPNFRLLFRAYICDYGSLVRDSILDPANGTFLSSRANVWIVIVADATLPIWFDFFVFAHGWSRCAICAILTTSPFPAPRSAQMHKSAKRAPYCVNHSTSICERNAPLVGLMFSTGNPLETNFQLATETAVLGSPSPLPNSARFSRVILRMY